MRKLGILTITFSFCLASLTLFAQEKKAADKQQAGSSVAPSESASKPSQEAQAPPFIIGPGDILDVSVWKEPNFSRQVPVRPDGKISLPLLNDIQAAGQSPMQLAAAITEKLKKYVTDPQVTVTVMVINSQKVYVVGEVLRPGPIPLLPGMTALQALSLAGGITQFARPKYGYVLRKEGGKDTYYPLNYRNLLRGDMQGNIVLKSGDTIVVP
jgi:polysaccharide export outer membrane protein